MTLGILTGLFVAMAGFTCGLYAANELLTKPDRDEDELTGATDE